MKELLALLTTKGGKGAVAGNRAAVLLLCLYIANETTETKKTVQQMSVRLAVVETQIALQGSKTNSAVSIGPDWPRRVTAAFRGPDEAFRQ